MPLFFSLHLFGLSHSLPYHFIACPRLNRYVTQTWIILIFKKKKKIRYALIFSFYIALSFIFLLLYLSRKDLNYIFTQLHPSSLTAFQFLAHCHAILSSILSLCVFLLSSSLPFLYAMKRWAEQLHTCIFTLTEAQQSDGWQPVQKINSELKT